MWPSILIILLLNVSAIIHLRVAASVAVPVLEEFKSEPYTHCATESSRLNDHNMLSSPPRRLPVRQPCGYAPGGVGHVRRQQFDVAPEIAEREECTRQRS